MHRIRGRVLAYETGIALPNLIIAAYDIDPQDRESSPNVSANRLGSAATDSQGEFTIEFTDEEFREGDPEGRPDITIAVFAPTVAGKEPEREAPVHSFPRIRRNAGREEAFVLYLPTALLREHHVPLHAPGLTRSGQTADVGEAVKIRVASRTMTKHAVREALRPEVERQMTVRKAATQEVKRLIGGIPRRGTIANRFVPAGANATPILKSARQAGIKRLASIEPPGVRIAATPAMAEALGVEYSDDGTVTASQMIAVQAFEAYLGSHLAIPVRFHDPLLQCKIAHQVEQVTSTPSSESSAPPGAAPSVSGNGSVPTGESDDPASAIYAAILAQLQQLVLDTAHDGDASIGIRPDADVIADDLAVELTSGPADGPALHDFHHLQIAWENVWTAVVDDELAAKMGKLYQEVVELVDWGDAEPDLSEIGELDSFLNMLEEALETAAGIFQMNFEDVVGQPAGGEAATESESFAGTVKSTVGGAGETVVGTITGLAPSTDDIPFL